MMKDEGGRMNKKAEDTRHKDEGGIIDRNGKELVETGFKPVFKL